MKRLAVLAVAAAALLAPSAALASGVVLHVQKASQLVAVTRSSTKVVLVHTAAASRLHAGQRVALTARTLRNGTLAASKVRVVGRAHSVRFRGLLMAKSPGKIVVSAGGAPVTITRSANDSAPPTGSVVDVTATFDNQDDLDEDTVSAVSADHPGGAIEGKLTIGTGTITVVAEHMALVLNVPTGFDLTTFANGDEVLAQFAQQPDGTLLLTALSNNEDARHADGEDGDHQGDGGGGGGGDGGNDD